MRRILRTAERVGGLMELVGGAALTFIVLLTTADVILRAFGHPLPGTYEVVGIGGAIVIGFVAPITSLTKGHVFVDSALGLLPIRVQAAVKVLTRCVGIALFLVIGWNLLRLGVGYRATGQVSSTLQLPLFPVAWGLGACFCALAIALVCDILKIAGGTDE